MLNAQAVPDVDSRSPARPPCQETSLRRPPKEKGAFPGNCAFLRLSGADVGIRTPDLLITNQLLYQLSYIGLLSILKGNI